MFIEASLFTDAVILNLFASQQQWETQTDSTWKRQRNKCNRLRPLQGDNSTIFLWLFELNKNSLLSEDEVVQDPSQELSLWVLSFTLANQKQVTKRDKSWILWGDFCIRLKSCYFHQAFIIQSSLKRL